ncbi:MAG: hypothetical protein AAGB46_06395 [Verrucomicrobiota bacterium]
MSLATVVDKFAQLDLGFSNEGLTRLSEQARREWHQTRYPWVDWVPSLKRKQDEATYNVVIVGAGQSGVAAAAALMKHRVDPLLVIDQRPTGFEGPWVDFARMPTLRSGKFLVGMDQGLASLTAESWFRAAYGDAAWESLDKIPTLDWVRYLLWFRKTLNIPVQNETELVSFDYCKEEDLLCLELEAPEGPKRVWARRIIFANGIEGSGDWKVPSLVSENLSPHLYASTSGQVDFEDLRGKRLGVLGAGASAFDNAGTALEAGAESVDLFYRRRNLPRVNPNRWMENAGFLAHYASLSDAWKWKFYYNYWAGNQPPTQAGYDRCICHSNFRLHPGTLWRAVREVDGKIEIETDQSRHRFDFLVCATGIVFDLKLQPPLAPYADRIATWNDRYSPPADLSHPVYASMPYLGPNFEFLGRRPGELPWEGKVFCFNSGANLSMGIVGSAISGLKYGLRFLVEGVGRSLFYESIDSIFDEMMTFDKPELTAPDHV